MKDFYGFLTTIGLIVGFAVAYPYIKYDPPFVDDPQPTAEEATEHMAQVVLERPDRSGAASIGEQRRRDYEAPDPTDIILAPETGIGLGWGWNEFHGEAIPTQCVEFVRAKPFKGQTSMLDFTEVNDQYELQTALDMSASASVKTMAYEVQGEAKFSSETQINGSALTYVIEAEVLNAPWIAQPPGDDGGSAVRLTEAAERLAARDVELFKDVCGTGYISATYGGAKLSIVVEITTYSQSTREAISASVEGGGWGVKVDAAMSASSSSGTERATREIRFHQSGGKPALLPTEPDEIVEAAKTLADQADKAEKIFRIAITPYEALRNWPREENLSGSDIEYEELAALWGSYQSLYTGLQDALDAPQAHVLPDVICTGTDCKAGFSKIEDAQIETIKTMQDEIIIWLDRLELAARACMTAEEACQTNTTLYRTPYAYQVAMPVQTCLLDQTFDNNDREEFEKAEEKHESSLFKIVKSATEQVAGGGADGEDATEEPDESEPSIRLTCASTNLKSKDALKFFSDMMIDDTAKGRCAIGTLTPGCLSNAEISDWHDRIGHQAVILGNASQNQALATAIATAIDEDSKDDATKWPDTCTALTDPETWMTGDPGTTLKTSVWVPSVCFTDVKAIAASLRQ